MRKALGMKTVVIADVDVNEIKCEVRHGGLSRYGAAVILADFAEMGGAGIVPEDWDAFALGRAIGRLLPNNGKGDHENLSELARGFLYHNRSSKR